MKMLKEYMHQMLRGEQETITVSELRSSVGDILTQVSLGKSFCIKRKGKIVAWLVHSDNADVKHEILPDGTSKTLDLPKTPIELGRCAFNGCTLEFGHSPAWHSYERSHVETETPGGE